MDTLFVTLWEKIKQRILDNKDYVLKKLGNLY